MCDSNVFVVVVVFTMIILKQCAESFTVSNGAHGFDVFVWSVCKKKKLSNKEEEWRLLKGTFLL